MLVINNPRPDKLPLKLPSDVHFACFCSTLVEQHMQDNWEWGATTAQLLRVVQVDGFDDPSVGITSLDWGFTNKMANAIDQLKELGTKRTLEGPSGRHIGFVLVCEMWRLRHDVDNELAELVAGDLAEGAHQYRVAMGLLADGWKVSLMRRRGEQAVLRVARPDDEVSKSHFAESMMAELDRLNLYVEAEAESR